MFDGINKWLCFIMSLTYLGCSIFGGWILNENEYNRPADVEITLAIVVTACYIAFAYFISVWLHEVSQKYWGRT